MKHCEYCGSDIPWVTGDYPKRYEAKRFCGTSCANHARGINKAEYVRKRHDGRMRPLHRVIMEEHLGRKLGPRELVHHKNGDKLDNRLENLEVIDAGDHARLHNNKYPRTKTCAVCGVEFEPHPTKRGRAQCCSWECGKQLAAAKGAGVPIHLWLRQHGGC